MSESTDSIRDTIIVAAARLIVARGYDGVAMREIAEAAGISKPGLYYHFRDKEDLLEAVLTHWVAETEALVIAARQAPNTRARLSVLVRGLFAQAPLQRALIRLGTQDLPRLGEATRERIQRCYASGFLEPIEAIIRDGVAQGELRPVNPHLTTWLLLGMLYPFFHTDHPCARLADEHTATRIVESLLDGIAAR
ncbi:MAG: TetR/AcrR family transcriptional regulator [Chloroflexaceae bacterium]